MLCRSNLDFRWELQSIQQPVLAAATEAPPAAVAADLLPLASAETDLTPPATVGIDLPAPTSAEADCPPPTAKEGSLPQSLIACRPPPSGNNCSNVLVERASNVKQPFKVIWTQGLQLGVISGYPDEIAAYENQLKESREYGIKCLKGGGKVIKVRYIRHPIVSFIVRYMDDFFRRNLSYFPQYCYNIPQMGSIHGRVQFSRQ